MRRSKRLTKKPIVESSSSDSEDESPPKKQRTSPLLVKQGTSSISAKSSDKSSSKKNDSSSESDIENYLQPADKIDLSSSFFNVQKKSEFEKIERTIFSGVTRLSDTSDSEGEDKISEIQTEPIGKGKARPNTSDTKSNPKLNFQQLHDFTRKLEEAKEHVAKYNARKSLEKSGASSELGSSKISHELDVSSLLAVGETKQLNLQNIREEDLHSSDFETSDDEWEEVKVNENEEVKEKVVPKEGLQITVGAAMPEHCRKKKGVDLLAAMKRRLNRIRKDNQVYVHKVHALCWIAHGNFVNGVINDTKVLALAYSLLPSDKCYPSDRTDLSYLEQIVQWYRKTVQMTLKPSENKTDLIDSLQAQITKKTAVNYKMCVYIFVAILRALGIQCRLVVSFQVEPLRPPASELHSEAKSDKSPKKYFIKRYKRGHKQLIEEMKRKNASQVKDGKDNTPSGKHSQRSDRREGQDTKSSQKDRKPERDKLQNAGDVKGVKSTKIRGREKDTKRPHKDKKPEGDKPQNTGKTKDVKTVTISDKTKQKFATDTSTNLKVSSNAQGKDKDQKRVPKDTLSGEPESSRSKTADPPKKTSENRTTRSKSTSKVIKVKFPNKNVKEKKVPQVDGLYDSSESDWDSELPLSQLDGTTDDTDSTSTKQSKKVNLKKLRIRDQNRNTVPTVSNPSKPSFEKLKSLNDKVSKASNPSKPSFEKLKSPRNDRPVGHPSRLKISNDESSGDEFRPGPAYKKLSLSPKKTFTQSGSLDVRNDIISLIKGRIAEQKHIDRGKMGMKRKPESNSDSDYAPEPIKRKRHDSDSDIDYFVSKPKVKKRVQVKREEPGKKIISSESDLDEAGKKKKKGVNVWVEVFLEAEEKWITVDVVKGQVHCVNEIYTRATHPVTYILAWNNDNAIKDVTRRYCKNFSTVTRKLRVDPQWWEQTLEPFTGKQTARDREEDDDLDRQQLDEPMPKAISEYKNHPLYALRRHLLKFEAIYPPDQIPIGFVRKEAVYPRSCVYVCKSRDIWVKDARVVKPGEKPYKIVKARPKYDKLSNTIITGQLLEIFGPWQTMDYEPPTAENGVVPRSAFGNVELFKPCMLPKGTVHLKLAGLNKVCRKMNIDCASAIVGFDFHGGWSHPTYDGFVVCQEYEDQVVMAWELAQEDIERKEEEKIEKRVYGSWRKLIRGLLIRERLKAKYDFGDVASTSGSKGKKKAKPTKKAKKLESDSEGESD